MRLDPTLKQRAKDMRANPTPAEQKLWLAVRANRFENQQFTRQTIIAIERGKYSPSLEVAFQIAHALGVRLDEVFSYPTTTSNGDSA